MTYQKQWVERNDNVAGYVYFVEAVGFGGWIPGKLKRRCKIGLTRSVQKRLDEFHANQPAHDLHLIKAIYVDDMAAVESELHQQFKHCQVKLLKSREWFDLNPLQFYRCLWLMNEYDSERPLLNFSPKLVVGSIIGLCGVGLMIHQSIPNTPTTNQIHAVTQQAITASPQVIKTHKHLNKSHK